MAPRTILVVGNANLDIILGHIDRWPARGTEAFFEHADLRVGGSAANTALVLQRLGAKSGLVSARGSDFAGQAIAHAFEGPLDHVAQRPGATGFTVGLLHPESERTFLSSLGHLGDLDAGFFRTALDGMPLDGALVLVSGGFAMPAVMDGHRALQDWLRQRGAEIAIDPGWPDGGWTPSERDMAHDWIAGCDHLLVNNREAAALAGNDNPEVAMAALAQHVGAGATVVIKRGADGAIGHRAGQTLHASTSPARPIDTVGAGDSFNAGYLDALARGLLLHDCLKHAVAVAGAVIAEFPRTASPLPAPVEGVPV
ncbi:MAG: carbohydrate kinase family protein [Roseitalea sp.]|jgi:sugar/nucleoside kinase (ribokinase family)|nr:carbohydrate kinase family protein [Roseitalea sp.]MBO6721440.1 carbohydrate kinase family protein [Roseitalea sp.]MBO6741997.1 carbohydrate kinase family protein [Roseitalea sp.]